MSEHGRIRAAVAADVEVLVSFNAAMAAETEARELDREVLRKGVEALIHDPRRGQYLVLEQDGRVVAALMLTTEWSDWRNGFFWWIQSVYVHPDHRRRGLYRRLYDHVVERAAANGEVCGLRLYVERENRTARATYERLGMAETPYRVYETA